MKAYYILVEGKQTEIPTVAIESAEKICRRSKKYKRVEDVLLEAIDDVIDIDLFLDENE